MIYMKNAVWMDTMVVTFYKGRKKKINKFLLPN